MVTTVVDFERACFEKMYLMYVDESGDSGLVNSPTRYFVLSGLVLHELRWRECLEQLIEFRKGLRDEFGIKLREELHASDLVNNPGELVRVKRYHRLEVLRRFADELASMSYLSIINIVVDKQIKSATFDPFERAWSALIQRFENTMSHHNFPGPSNADDRGIVLPDATDDKKLKSLMRKMRRFNPIPNQSQYGTGSRNLRLQYIIEDPIMKSSDDSYITQAADLVAYLLYQNLQPNSYMKSKQGNNYFYRLEPVLCKAASTKDTYGIVRL